MEKWLRSAQGLVTLSFLALLSLLVRSYVDTRFILVEDFANLGERFVAVWIVGFTAIIGGWVWAVIAFQRGSRRSVTWLLVFALVTALGFGAASLLNFVSYPIEIAIFTASLIAGSLAAISAFLHLIVNESGRGGLKRDAMERSLAAQLAAVGRRWSSKYLSNGDAMKRKALIVAAAAVGTLALLVIAIWPAGPLVTAATPIPLPTPEGQAPIPLIFDDDGSPDGVIALLFFLRNPLYSVEAVTVSPGEAHPALFAQHVAQLLAVMGRPDIPVGVGRETPLEGNNAFPEPWRQASDTFWDISLPEAADPLVSHAAPKLIVDTLNGSAQPVVIFVSGTHTNLAEALRLDPSIREHIREVLVMGGSAYVEGNIESVWPAIHNRVAEWNIWVDPIAASEVFSSALPLHVVPLDATNRVMWNEADARNWAASGSPEGTLAAQLLRWMLREWSPDGVYVWDLVTAVVTTDSRLCPEVALALDVIVTPGSEQGRTVVEDQSPNAEVCLTPDAPQVKERATAMFAR